MAGDMAAYAGLKRTLLGGLTGTVLEIGAGDGANFDYLPSGVRWIGLEPSRRRRGLAARATAYGHPGCVLDARAERVPLAEASVDAVVGTIVLCSVSDQDRVLGEVMRVLRPRWQVCVLRACRRRARQLVASRTAGGGADLASLRSRLRPEPETWHAIERAGFATVDLRWFASPGPLRTRIPYFAGYAETRR